MIQRFFHWMHERRYRADVIEGYRGDSFREFAELGVSTVRHQFENRALPDDAEHNLAGQWLGIQERRARILTYVPLFMALIATLALLVAFYKR